MTYTTTVTLEDGRRVRAVQQGYVEFDTNAFVETEEMKVTWEETGEMLTDEELNARMRDGSFLHEWIDAHADWKAE